MASCALCMATEEQLSSRRRSQLGALLSRPIKQQRVRIGFAAIGDVIRLVLASQPRSRCPGFRFFKVRRASLSLPENDCNRTDDHGADQRASWMQAVAAVIIADPARGRTFGRGRISGVSCSA